MAIADITKPMALDETLQATNVKLQAIADALGNQSIIGDTDISGIADGTLTGAVAQFDGDITDLDTDKADKVTGATAGNLAGLDSNGDLTDANWSADKNTTSATGNPISISGLKSNQLAINPIITLEPIQAGSGTPSPVNQRPISGYDKVEVLSCGKNIFNPEYLLTRSGWYKDANNVYNGLNSALNQYTYPELAFELNTQYTFSAKFRSDEASSTWFFFAYTDGTEKHITVSNTSETLITLTSDAGKSISYMTFSYGASTTIHLSEIQLEKSASATTYSPYDKSTSISESLGQTVYGLTHEVRTGKARVTKDAVDLGDLSWSYSSGMAVFYADLPSNTPEPKMGGYDAVCSIYACYTGSYSGQGDKTFTINNTSWESIKRVWIKDSSYTDPTVFKTAVTGQKLVYPLANPIEIQLTPHEISLLKDYAYVSTNGTSIALDYHNGELASLADVSQLGETVNLLPYGLLKSKVFTLTPNANGRIELGLIDDMIPIAIFGLDTGYYGVMRVASTNRQYYYAKVYGDNGDKGTLESRYIVYGLPIK